MGMYSYLIQSSICSIIYSNDKLNTDKQGTILNIVLNTKIKPASHIP